MRVLVLNCGSSSLKFEVMAAHAGDHALSGTKHGWASVARGIVDRFGQGGRLRFEVAEQAHRSEAFEAPDVRQAVDRVLGLLSVEGFLGDLSAVGHRVVHGGATFAGPAVIDDEVASKIEALSRLAPLHNGPALKAIRVARRELKLPHVAVFDTSFYAGLPDHTALYALPRELSEKHSIRRYGFHGLAHRAMVERYSELHPGAERSRLITLQLGNGCSITASKDGAPVDTSMGFTPLEGLIMGTRSGDLDPMLPLFIAHQEQMSLDDVEALLNRRSGLLGLSGRSSDMRDLLLAVEGGDRDAELAVNAFCYRAQKYVGAYLAVLGGADGIVFGGGIGQNSPEVRARILAGLEWAGIVLDDGRNNALQLTEGRISADSAAIETWVMDVDEASIIAHDVYQCLAA